MREEIQQKEERIILQLPGKSVEIPVGRTLLQIASEVKKEYSSPIVGAVFNNILIDLYKEISGPGKLEFLDLQLENGMRIYRQSLVFLLAKAAYELNPVNSIVVKHALGKSYYCEIKGKKAVSPLEVIELEAKMRELVAADEPIIPHMLTRAEAAEILARFDRQNTIEILDIMWFEKVRIYSSGPYSGYSYSYLAPSTGCLTVFKLVPHNNGFLLCFPDSQKPAVVAPCPKLPKLGQVWEESQEWAKILGISDLAGFWRLVAKNPQEANNLIHIGEALQEKKIAKIADEIFAKREKLRVILIAGPSSSGKTTFAQRLSIQLRVLGLHPVSVSTDDYFVDREHTPRDEFGDFDFEALEAVDVQLFNEHLQLLMECCEVECPIYNFQKGGRELQGKITRVDKDHPIIVEGIHALNERLTPMIKRENKYKIYISALTQTFIDDHNRIQTTDARLIRRIVRDNQFRAHDAVKTLQRWPSVRRGEEKNIFPYQEDADMMFNSALVYELSIFKKYAEPLFMAISSNEKEYSDARRLLDLLSFFPLLPDKNVPLNSILREFIGGSSIHGN